MEFWNKNQLQTSTQITVTTGTLMSANVMSRDIRRQYITENFDNDLTTASMTIRFDETTTISRICLDGINLKKFNLYYNGATANTFALTTTAATTTSQWITNSTTGMAIAVTPVNVTSLTIDMYSTQVANAEKAIGWFCVSSQLLDFTKIPNAGSYDPMINVEQKEHKLSDGGIRIHTIERKFSASIKLKWISSTFKDSLYTVWKSADDFVFMGFPTTTSWDGIGYEVVWPGRFDFFEFADNNTEAGYKGSITLKEISR